jgi:hypothetical protein
MPFVVERRVRIASERSSKGVGTARRYRGTIAPHRIAARAPLISSGD